jgi:methionine synthase II (cobalamin-independent)
MHAPAFCGAPTVVGSFPHVEAQALVETLLRRLPALPGWPQLPARDFRESMYVQYCEGLPGAVIDRERERLFFRADDGFAAQLEGFYEAVVTADVERFAISREHALGLHTFLDAIDRLGAGRPAWLKGQVTGPFSFAMSVTDEGKRALAYTPELCEVAVQGMALKARWMARTLRGLAADALVVLDEPYLCSFGSAFVNMSREEVMAAIDGAAAAVHAEGALCGLHCCGNTDWSLVLQTAIDVVNFDAHEYFQGLSLYPAELSAFLERGGVLSWGIVPTSGEAAKLGATALLRELDEHVEELTRKGLSRERLLRQSLITPACGLGTRTLAEAEQVLDVLGEVAQEWQRRGAAV